MKLFRERPVKQYFKNFHNAIENEIKNMQESEFMKADHITLMKKMVESKQVHHLEINLKQRTSDVELVKILGEHHPSERHFDVDHGVGYFRARVNYEYAILAEPELISYEPTGFRYNGSIEGVVKEGKLIVYCQTWHGDKNLPIDIKSKVKNDMGIIEDDIKLSVVSINNDIDKFNNELEDFITKKIVVRGDEINRKNDQNDDCQISKLEDAGSPLLNTYNRDFL